MPSRPDELSDEDLMAHYCADGDRSSFEALFRRHGPRLYGYFVRSTGSEAVAHDLVQATFLHVHRARRDFRQGSPLRPWLYAIAANVRREHFRARQRKPEAPMEGAREPSVDPMATTPTERAVRRALLELPDAQREVVVLHWYEGWSFPEIAQLVGASHSAVKVRAHRAYERLRQILGGSA